MTATDLRPRSAVEIIDAAFQLMRRNYLEMVAVAGVIIVPLAALELLSPLLLAVFFSMLRSFFSLVAIGAIIYIASQAYLGEPVSIGDALRVLRSRLLPLLAASLIQALMILMGFMFLIIPGFLLTAWLFAMPTVVVLERRGPLEAIGRSYELASGFVLKIIGIFVLTYVIYFLIIAAFGALYFVLSALPRMGEQSIGFLINVFTVLALPLWACISVILYYDLRIRKEGFDLQVMARRLEQSQVQTR